MAEENTKELVMDEIPAEELPAKLEQLKANATREYSLKNYEAAAEIFSDAAAVQDQVNGEMSVENADLLYQYGRCLYKVAVSTSDVLGGKVAGPSEPKRKKRKTAHEDSSSAAATIDGESNGSLIADAIKSGEEKTAEEVVEAIVEQKHGVTQEEKPTISSNPFFSISGDDNFTDSEDEGEEGDEQEEEEDDFAIAYEVLDMARVLLGRKIATVEETNGKGKSKQEDPELRQLKERLADTHDLQAEISLENETFKQAVQDTQSALSLKRELFPEESSLIAEAHFKLSLALEFASVTATEELPGGGTKVASVDEGMRKQAAEEMELAIASCKLRLNREEGKLSSLQGNEAAEQQKEVTEVKEILADMKQRLTDLRKPAQSLSGMQPAGAPGMDDDALRGVLGAMLGESKAEQAKRIEQATQNANDLTGMVKKKKPKQETSAAPAADGMGKGKRKAEDNLEGVANDTNGKKVKFTEGTKSDDGDAEPTSILDY